MEFQTKQDYLDWRQQKRAEYAFLSANLRQIRQRLGRTQSASMKAIRKEQVAAKAESRPARWRVLVVNVAADQHTKLFLRAEARKTMAERAEAKAIARESWERWQQSNQP